MESSTSPQRILVVAHRTAATPALIEAVRERAARGPATFTLLVPNPAHGLHRLVDPEDQEVNEAQTVLDLALPLLEEAAGAHVEGMIGDAEPLNAIQDAVNLNGFNDAAQARLEVVAHRPAVQGQRPRAAGHDGDGEGPSLRSGAGVGT
jgi:hypothetical protein